VKRHGPEMAPRGAANAAVFDLYGEQKLNALGGGRQ
jgi:hypothetical protein